MNRLPSSASFQGVLDSIIRNYLLNELPPNGTQNGNARHLVAEKDLGLVQENGLPMHNPHQRQTGGEVNNNAGPVPSTSTAAANANAFTSGGSAVDHEYIKAIYQSFERRGVFKELQTFLRHKLVSILQDEWPNLQKPVSASQKEGPNTIVYRLVDDFLRCHKLLYTLSVLASESDVKPQSTRVLYGKMSAKEAEDLLNEMGIKHNSRLSGQILKCYFDKENFSLLESIHYLGVWLDEASGQLDNSQQDDANSERHERRRGSCGESIVLSKRKTVESQTITQNGKKDNVLGIEKRLLELEKNLEREKEFKIKEAIEKYKKEEHVKLREEMEMKYKLELIEKERDHFMELQRKLEEVNAERQLEREQWLEVKIGLEKELCGVKKQLNDMIQASGDKNWKSASTRHITFSNEESPPIRMKTVSTATKTCQVALDESPVKCSCGKHSCHANNRGETFSTHCNRQSTLDPIEQDRLAFLQYRMEQQDEEIQTLRNQLLLSSQKPAPKSKPKSPAGTNTTAAGAQKATTTGTGHRQESSSTSEPSDDLEVFLSRTKARVQKLDFAVDKVDEIVQEVFAKRRSPLSRELSSRLLSTAMNKNKPSLSQLYSSLHNMSSVPVLSPMNIPSIVPLMHQQVPEKQSAYSPFPISQASPPPPITTIYPRNPGVLTVAGKLFPSPPLSSWSRREPERTTVMHSGANLETRDRPKTPEDRMFPVAYGQPMQSGQRQKESRESSKESTPRTVIKSPREPLRPSNNGNGALRTSTVAEENEPEESLFHMAIRTGEAESNNLNETFEEKAIRNGALSREKILSSDEGENSISMSISISGSQSRKVSKPIMKPVLNNGINTKDTRKAISKTKVSETLDKADQLPMKATASTAKSVRRPSLSSPPVKKVSMSPPSSSSSSSRKSKSISEARNSPRNAKVSQQERQQDEYEDEESSLNISAPKSLGGDDNNEDFWQL